MEKENVLFLGLLRVLLSCLLTVRNMFDLIFTGVALLISYFVMKFKFIFLIHFFLFNIFYFQCLLSQNTVNVNFQCLLSQITVPMVFSSFNSINDFKITIWNTNQINMISNKVNGMQSTRKRLKMIQYFKNKLLLQGLLLFQ